MVYSALGPGAILISDSGRPGLIAISEIDNQLSSGEFK
jgi:hypothetical protein